MSDSQRPHGLQPTRLFCPWDFPGKSTGVACHCLLQMNEWSLINIQTAIKTDMDTHVCVYMYFIYFLALYIEKAQVQWTPSRISIPFLGICFLQYKKSGILREIIDLQLLLSQTNYSNMPMGTKRTIEHKASANENKLDIKKL